jgi:hypothetical protein
MPFLTIFTTPKSFTFNPHINLIQRNALQSWLHLGPEVEVFLVGNEDGMAETAREFHIRHLPDVRCSEYGTPYLSSMYDLARRHSQAPYLAHLNADILLRPDFIAAVRQVAGQSQRFLALGRRWDLDLRQPLDFSPGWEERLEAEVQARGKLHSPAGSDYFVFPRPLLADMPDFTIGRSGWDNWTIYHASRSGWDVVDISRSAMVVHQDHDYSHLPDNKPPYDLPETLKNIAISGGMRHMYTILETNKLLIDGQVRPARFTLPRLYHRLELLINQREPQGLRRTILRRLRQLRRKYDTVLEV